jgi:ATP-dependent DNA helicase PIF1
MKFCIVVVCTPKKVYHQVTKNSSDQVSNIIKATILNGKFKGEYVLLPRIPMIPTDVSVEFKRLQFPVRLTFVMTIKKAQGHRYKRGLNFENTCFLHGQLYVACSRVGKASDLFVCTPEEKTKNFVFSKSLQ